MVYVWLALITLALIVEASTATLVAIWFIPSGIVAALLAKIGASLAVQIVVFFGLSIAFIVFARKIVAKSMKKTTVATNADALIGETGVVTQEINNLEARGVVKVKGQVWSAKSQDNTVISDGVAVEILAIEGVKLIVKEK